jgi:hypothetical protein
MARARTSFCFAAAFLGSNEPLPGVLLLHLRPVRIDRRHQPGLAAIFGKRRERIRSFELGPHSGDTAVGCQRLQIQVRNGDHDEIASVSAETTSSLVGWPALLLINQSVI